MLANEKYMKQQDAIVATAGKSVEFIEGVPYLAVFSSYIEKGAGVSFFQGVEKPIGNQVLIGFKIIDPAIVESAGFAPRVSDSFQVSYNEKANYYKFFKVLQSAAQKWAAAQGKTGEFPTITSMINRPFYVKLVANRKDGTTYWNIRSGGSFHIEPAVDIDMKTKKSTAVPFEELPNEEVVCLTWHKPLIEEWNKLYKVNEDGTKSLSKIQETIMQAPNFIGSELERCLPKQVV